ncbi:MAG TPA: hypothetical protein VKD65_15935, partial [Candidatus Angelobacter sp.]|nr:hypothetical protein [Candidatus Angelobacter sp.]
IPGCSGTSRSPKLDSQRNQRDQLSSISTFPLDISYPDHSGVPQSNSGTPPWEIDLLFVYHRSYFLVWRRHL